MTRGSWVHFLQDVFYHIHIYVDVLVLISSVSRCDDLGAKTARVSHGITFYSPCVVCLCIINLGWTTEHSQCARRSIIA